MQALRHARRIYTQGCIQGMRAASGGPKPLVVALTGGPCGGKSSALAALADQLRAGGFETYTVPEVPTILFSNGAQYPGHDAGEELVEFEHAVVNAVTGLEDAFLAVARSTRRRSAVLCDRGALDIGAYLPGTAWSEVLTRMGTTEAALCARYDLVLHLVTAADGAEHAYTLSNNPARTESAEEARALDARLAALWSSHPRRDVIDNSTNFQGKLDRCRDALGRLIAAHAAAE